MNDLSDLELVASAVQAAMEAHEAGVIIGPVDEVALRRWRRALRADIRRCLTHTHVSGGDAA